MLLSATESHFPERLVITDRDDACSYTTQITPMHSYHQ